jgi:hypothetical protein
MMSFDDYREMRLKTDQYAAIMQALKQLDDRITKLELKTYTTTPTKTILDGRLFEGAD